MSRSSRWARSILGALGRQLPGEIDHTVTQAGAGVGGQSGGLVHDQIMLVFVEDCAFHFVEAGAWRRGPARMCGVDRGDADFVARSKAVVGLYAATVDSDLAAAEQLIDKTLGRVPESGCEVIVDAPSDMFVRHGIHFNIGASWGHVIQRAGPDCCSGSRLLLSHVAFYRGICRGNGRENVPDRWEVMADSASSLANLPNANW